MARVVRKVVQVERLRDQVYQLIRDDLKAGIFVPGQRIVEADLAARYEVSRTPVREALFQLSRDGILVSANERGYEVPVDTREKVRARHEVRDLLDPKMAYHSAIEGNAEQRKRLAKAQERQRAAHEADKLSAFVDANLDFRATLREMCGNELLAKCSALVDDQAQSARRSLFVEADNRLLETDHSERILEAVQARDGDAAEAAMRGYIAAVRSWWTVNLAEQAPEG